MDTWSDDRDGELRSWRQEGYSFELIARMFTKAGFARSKGSVIGRALRLGLIGIVKKSPRFKLDNHAKFKNPIASGAALFAKIKASRPAAARPTNNDVAVGEFLGLHLLELDLYQCRYPHGDDPVLFCGQPQQEGSSYCPTHHRLCNVKTKALT